MNIKRTSLIAVAITTSLTLSACSSSNKDTPAGNTETESEQGLGTDPDANDPQNDPNNGNSDNTDNDGSDNTDNDGSDNTDNDGSDNTDNDGSDNTDNSGNGNTDTNGSSTSLDLRGISNVILYNLAGEELEKLAAQIEEKAASAINSAISSSSLPDGSVDLTVQDAPQTFTVARSNYDCEQGGTLVVESLDNQISSTDFSSDINNVTYIFDQCQLGIEMGETLNGTTLFTRRTGTEGRGITTNEKTFDWQSFQWQQQGGTRIDVTASITADNFNSENNEANLAVSITEYTESKDDAVATSLQNTSFVLNEQAGPGYSEFSLETAGTVIDKSGTSITVETNPPVFKKRVNPMSGQESIPLGGQINFTADDGSSLQMAVRSGEGTERVTDITYTDKDGNTSVSANEPFIDIQVFAN